MGKKTVTVKEFLEAIEANNTPHKRGGWFDNNPNGKVGSACILGQACINLGVENSSLTSALNKVKHGSANKIINLNDHTQRPYSELVKAAKNEFKGLENHKLELETSFYHSEIGKA